MPYAIINRRNDKFVCGTDFYHYPPRQILSRECSLIFESWRKAENAMIMWKCGKDYEVVEVEVKVK